MERFARAFASAKTAVLVYSMGLTQHRFGVDNVKAVVNLMLARGMLGRPKCAILPIRGHSGVQGGGEIGCEPNKLPGGEVDAENAARLSALWGAPVSPVPGLFMGQILEACHEGAIDVLYNLGGNPLETMPDPVYIKDALERVPLRIHQDIVLNRAALLDAAEATLLLPAQTRYEQAGGGTATSTERRIRFSPQVPGPAIAEAIGLHLRAADHERNLDRARSDTANRVLELAALGRSRRVGKNRLVRRQFRPKRPVGHGCPRSRIQSSRRNAIRTERSDAGGYRLGSPPSRGCGASPSERANAPDPCSAGAEAAPEGRDAAEPLAEVLARILHEFRSENADPLRHGVARRGEVRGVPLGTPQDRIPRTIP
jgi:anaerobic selenocysteine-containing dehydrogenase